MQRLQNLIVSEHRSVIFWAGASIISECNIGQDKMELLRSLVNGRPSCYSAGDVQDCDSKVSHNYEKMRSQFQKCAYEAALAGSRRVHAPSEKTVVAAHKELLLYEGKYRDTLTKLFAANRERHELKANLAETTAMILDMRCRIQKVEESSWAPANQYHTVRAPAAPHTTMISRQYDDLCSAASKAFKESDFTACIARLQSASELKPPLREKVDLLSNLGLAYLKAKKTTESLSCYREAVILAKQIYSLDEHRYRAQFIDSLQQLVKVQIWNIQKLESNMAALQTNNRAEAISTEQDTDFTTGRKLRPINIENCCDPQVPYPARKGRPVNPTQTNPVGQRAQQMECVHKSPPETIANRSVSQSLLLVEYAMNEQCILAELPMPLVHPDGEKQVTPKSTCPLQLLPSPEASQSTHPLQSLPSPEASQSTSPLELLPCPKASQSTHHLQLLPSPEASQSTFPLQLLPCPKVSQSTHHLRLLPCPDASQNTLSCPEGSQSTIPLRLLRPMDATSRVPSDFRTVNAESTLKLAISDSTSPASIPVSSSRLYSVDKVLSPMKSGGKLSGRSPRGTPLYRIKSPVYKNNTFDFVASFLEGLDAITHKI